MHDIIYLPNNQSEYIDQSAQKGIAYTYQIRGYTNEVESAISLVMITKQSDDVVDDSGIIVYPNPAFDIVNVISDLNTINQIDIFSSAGIRLNRITYPKKNLIHLPVGDLVTGIYFLKIQIGDQSITKKYQ